jgi:hypothetical protein
MVTASRLTQEAAVPRRAISETALLLEIPHTALNLRQVGRIAFGSGGHGHLIGLETSENRRSLEKKFQEKQDQILFERSDHEI